MAYTFIGLHQIFTPQNQVFIDGLNPQELYNSVNPGRWKRIKKKFTIKVGGFNYKADEQNSQDVLEIAQDHPWQDIIAFANHHMNSDIIYSFDQESMIGTQIFVKKCFKRKWQVDRLTYTMNSRFMFFPDKSYEFVIVKNDRLKEAYILETNDYHLWDSKDV